MGDGRGRKGQKGADDTRREKGRSGIRGGKVHRGARCASSRAGDLGDIFLYFYYHFIIIFSIIILGECYPYYAPILLRTMP
jgi:hypothetical protein